MDGVGWGEEKRCFSTLRMTHSSKSNNNNKNNNSSTMSNTNTDNSNDNEKTEPLPLQWTQLGASRSLSASAARQEDAAAATAAAATNNANDSSFSAITMLPRDPSTETTAAAAAAAPTPADTIRYPHDVAGDDDIFWDDAAQYNEICLVGTAGQKITHLGNDFSTSRQAEKARKTLKKLIFRSHLITDMDCGNDGGALRGFESLELLELYDNQIPSLHLPPNLGKTLLVLDMSFNVIRDMTPIGACPMLREVYLANNKISSMSGLETLTNLQKLDLGANRIREINPLQLIACGNTLQELWLGKNKITKIQGLSHLQQLRRLDIQSNRLTCIENISNTHLPKTLQELYLASNGITDDGITGGTTSSDGSGDTAVHEGGFTDGPVFAVLTVLDLSRNQLGGSSGSSSGNENNNSGGGSLTVLATKCPVLEELWLSGNQFSSWNQVHDLQALKLSLETIYLEYNPLQTNTAATVTTSTTTATSNNNNETMAAAISSEDATTTATNSTTTTGSTTPKVNKNLGMKQNNPDHSMYRQRLLQLIPSLTQIDANPVTAMERARATAQTTLGMDDTGVAATATTTAMNTSTSSSPKVETARLLQERAIQRARLETEKSKQINKNT